MFIQYNILETFERQKSIFAEDLSICSCSLLAYTLTKTIKTTVDINVMVDDKATTPSGVYFRGIRGQNVITKILRFPLKCQM